MINLVSWSGVWVLGGKGECEGWEGGKEARGEMEEVRRRQEEGRPGKGGRGQGFS